jgi:tetratricopeptide (TPR) repeat protein
MGPALYERALALRPYDHKYLTNFLFLQFHIQRNSAVDKARPMPADWVIRLESVLREHPDFSPAIRLKAFLISEIEGPEAAEAYLSTSQAWENDKAAMRQCAAEIYKDAGNNEKALSLIEDAESLEPTSKPTSYSLKAFILMRLALNDTSTSEELELHGYGPKRLNLNHLRRSLDVYSKAITGFREAGYPLFSEAAFTNFSAVAGLLGRPEACQWPCQEFLQYHPKCASVAAALASSLYIRIVVQKQRIFSRHFISPIPNRRDILRTLYFVNSSERTTKSSS